MQLRMVRLVRTSVMASVALWLPCGCVTVPPREASDATPPIRTTTTVTPVTTTASHAEFGQPIEALVARVTPSIVQLSAPMPPRLSHVPLRVVEGDPFEVVRAGPLGTGVAVGHGLLLTAAHVVEHATSLRVRTASGKEHIATVVSRDPARDLALLRIHGDSAELPALALCATPPAAGEWLAVVGNLYGRGPTVSVGVVGAGPRMGKSNAEAIESDVAVNLTNTGGPMLNMQGEIVGIANAKLTEQRGMRGLGYGTAAGAASALLANQRLSDAPLRRADTTKPTALRGITTDDLSTELRKRFSLSADLNHGAVVTRVDDDSPAAAIGIEPGDVFVEVDFAPVWTSDGFAQANAGGGGPLLVLVVRGNAAAYVLLNP
jgi:S1-C subfamily serine protease